MAGTEDVGHSYIPHHLLPQHCSTCGMDWPKGAHGLCPTCKAGLPCRADTTDTVAPDPPCAGSRLQRGLVPDG